MGYYDPTRKCTQKDLAEFLGLKQNTVGEHLRHAESTSILMAMIRANTWGIAYKHPRTRLACHNGFAVGRASSLGMETQVYSWVPLYTGSFVPGNGFSEQIVEGIQ